MELTIEQILRQAVVAHKNGKLQEAERFYNTILKSQPRHPDANHNIGVIAVSVGRFEEALPFFKKAISVNQNQEQYWISLIEALIKLGRIFDARRVLLEAEKAGVEGDKIRSLHSQLHPSTKLDFFYEYLRNLGVFTSQKEGLVNGDSEEIPLLTSSFLNWFETQKWNSLSLLELGAGGSTLYFSKFFKLVTSYGTSQTWFDSLLLKVPNNVNLIKVDSIFENFQKNSVKDLHNFDVVLLDAGENRAKLARWLVNENYKGIIFFDNSEWYRKSIEIFLKEGFLEIPFFGIKPIEDWVSCTSILAQPSALGEILNGNWTSLPKLTWERPDNLWDDEYS